MNTKEKKSQIDSVATIKGSDDYKKENDHVAKIAELKQLYLVKGVKTFRGHEGVGYNANLYFGAKKIAFIIDDASGGDSYIEDEDMAALKELELACENVGLVPRSYPGWKDWESKYDIREFIGDLVNDYVERKKHNGKVSK